MRRRQRRGPSHSMLGDGTSFEEVLTVITVLLLLRVVFMVPMVNLDKAKTVTATKSDTYWASAVSHVLGAEGNDDATRPYRAAFGIRTGETVLVTRNARDVYVEAVSPDSSLLVIHHVPETREFVALRVQGLGSARSFRRGRLLWSQAEREWFVGADTVDYGSHPSSVTMEREFRAWTQQERGY
jgi:hypothetical protein